MAKYRFEQIAINSTEKKKPVEEDRFTYLGLEHLDSGSLSPSTSPNVRSLPKTCVATLIPTSAVELLVKSRLIT